MPVDMTLYFQVLKDVQEQVNRITYSHQHTEHERLQLLDKLEYDLKQKLSWARRSMSYVQSVSTKEGIAEASAQAG